MDNRDQSAATSCMGIVWGVQDSTGPVRLVPDRTSLARTEADGDLLTHSRGLHEAWEGWRWLSPAGLARRGGLPVLIAWLEQAPACHWSWADAEQFLLALAHAVWVEVGPVRDLAQRLPALAALATPDEEAPQRDVAP